MSALSAASRFGPALRGPAERMPRIADPRALDAVACRHLWAAVLTQCLKDALQPQGPSHTKRSDTWRAEAWIGSRDFRMVCDLAGIPAEACEAWARREMAAGGSAALGGQRRQRHVRAKRT